MEKFYAIDWMVDDNFNFNNKEESEQKSILLNEIEDTNRFDNVNIQLFEIENLVCPSGACAIIIKATKNDMIKLGYAEEEIDDCEVFI